MRSMTRETPPRAVLASNLMHLEIAERARVALAAAGIPCAFLKGVAFLDTLYDDLAARRLSDVDLLVPQRARPLLDAALAPAGLTPLPTPSSHPRSWATHYNRPYRTEQGVLVEVHLELCPRGLFAIDYDALWARVVERRCAERVVPTLSPEDTVLALAVHEAKHGFEVPPHNREDLRRVLERWRPDWAIVAGRARCWGAGAALHVALGAARASPPADVVGRLAPGPLRRRAIAALVSLPQGAPRRPVAGHPLPLLAILAAVTDRRRQMLRFAGGYLRRRGGDLLARAVRRTDDAIAARRPR